MRQTIFILLALLIPTAVLAQASPTYVELGAKIHHIKESYTGTSSNSDQALVIVLQKLCDNYQGHMSQQQYKSLSADITAMKAKTSDSHHLHLMDQALQTLQGKSDTLDIERRILNYYQKVPQELIYVHTDKPYYVPGDTVWFRAHLVDAVTHTPISRSRYVYVELHDQQVDTLMQRIIVKCDSDGVFANNILLPKTIQNGTYTLVAYTQWMRNFPAEHFFYKQLMIVGSSQQGNQLFLPWKQVVSALETSSFRLGNKSLEIAQRKGQLLIQLNGEHDEPLACTLYGSGNLIVTDYTPGKVLRIDSQSLRPGCLSIAMVNRETGDIVADGWMMIEAQRPQVNISGQAQSSNNPMELNITLTEADGTPLNGNFSVSVTDYDVVKPDTVQLSIDKYLTNHQGIYPLSDMLCGTFPHIGYSFQTSQTITGSVRGTIFKNIKHPQLMLVRPDNGFREVFELGDSCRFTINGLDFPDGTTYLLEGMRQTGSTNLVQLNIDPPTFPVLHVSSLPSDSLSVAIPENFSAQAKEQVMYGSIGREIELPEVLKEKKRKPRTDNRIKIEPFKAIYDDQPLLNNLNTMEILLGTLGLRVTHNDEGSPAVLSWTTGGLGPLIYIDGFASNPEELLMLQPSNLQSVEYFKSNDPRLLAYRWDAPTTGVLLVRLKPGYAGKKGHLLSTATVQQQGWKPNMAFYSPQYKDKSLKTRPDHRTTLYWNPKLTTDVDGHATVRFYASDISKRYLVTLEGVSDNGTIIRKQTIIE